MVGGCRPNVVDGPVSWREAPGAAGVEPDGRAVAAPPARGARPAGLVGHRGPIALESVPPPRVDFQSQRNSLNGPCVSAASATRN